MYVTSHTGRKLQVCEAFRKGNKLCLYSVCGIQYIHIMQTCNVSEHPKANVNYLPDDMSLDKSIFRIKVDKRVTLESLRGI